MLSLTVRPQGTERGYWWAREGELTIAEGEWFWNPESRVVRVTVDRGGEKRLTAAQRIRDSRFEISVRALVRVLAEGHP